MPTAQEAPEDVTGAAGVLAGGCGGGASWELGAELGVPGWLVAGLGAALDRDGAAAGELAAGAGDRLTAGRAVLA